MIMLSHFEASAQLTTLPTPPPKVQPQEGRRPYCFVARPVENHYQQLLLFNSIIAQ